MKYLKIFENDSNEMKEYKKSLLNAISDDLDFIIDYKNENRLDLANEKADTIIEMIEQLKIKYLKK